MFEKTLTGLTLEEAFTKLKQVLPPRAYKQVPGGADLTDINPAYLTVVATEVFGPVGVGWYYDYEREDLVYHKEEKTFKNGNTVTKWSANIVKFVLTYVYYNSDGFIEESKPVISNGGSDNDSLSYAIRGALTNALGAAFAKLLWQVSVYQGLVTHKNATAMYDLYTKKMASKFSQEEEDAKNNKTDIVEDEVEDTVEEEESVKVVKENLAATVVIPEGIGLPLAGKTLVEASAHKTYGNAILRYLSGEKPNTKGNFFIPSSGEEELLKEAAIALLKK